MNVFYIDTSLKEPSGHCLNYAASLHKSLANRSGISFTAIGNKDLDAQKCGANFEILPHFTYWCDARPLMARTPLQKVWLFHTNENVMREHQYAMRKELAQLFTQLRIRPDDYLIFNTLRQWQFLPALEFLRSIGNEKCPKSRFIMHFTASPSPFGPDDMAKFFRKAFGVLRSMGFHEKIKILTDTDVLREEYIGYGCLEGLIEVCPIPHTMGATETDPQTYESEIITVGYLGEARTHKGFSQVTEGIARYESAKANNRVQFKVHCFSYHPDSDYIRFQIKRLETTSAELIRTQLIESDYYAFLSSIDIVLLPYLVDNYYAQTSGIFAEAMAMGKVIIASRGTWMADQLRAYGCGLLCVPSDGISLAEAIHDAVEHYSELKRTSAEAAVKWRRFHNPQTLLEQLL